MRSIHLLAAASLASALTLFGCDKARPLPTQGARPSGCVTCHGGELDSTGAPPYSLPRNAAGTIIASGNRLDHSAATTRIEVGAHTAHLRAGVSCGSCHVVPAQVSSPGHNQGTRATVVFKELAAAGNVVPSTWAPAVHTCTNYCHGASLNHGGTNHAPDWLGGPAAAACGSCHFAAGVTPPTPHPQGPGAAGAFASTTACATCHPDTVNTDGTINVAGGKHVNGVLDGGGGHSAGWVDPAQHGPAANGGLQNCTACHGADFAGGTSGVSCTACHATNGHPSWQTECTFCHGARTGRTADATFPNVGTGTVVRANLASPPLGSQGENSITAYAVGAHEAHVGGGTFARAAQCSECHGPTLPADTAHVNGQIVLGWSATAGNGIVPTPVAAGNYLRWSLANLTPGGANCTNFCHGATLAGGTNTSPSWVEGASGATCGSCHAIPLPYTAAGGWHVQRQDCSTCHPGYTSTSVNLADHIFVGAGPQGLTCTSCHGSSTANAAPPGDITGATSGGNAIGAHQKHVAGVTLHSGNFACTECHPDNGTNTRHANGVVNIVWGSTATANSTYTVAPATGTFTPGAAFPTCTNYCHNPRSTDTAATNKAPSWTGATGSAACGSCHGLPPVGTGHSTSTACGSCHDGYASAPTSASGASAVSLVNHLNGVVNVANLSCTSCHGTAGRTLAGADALLAAAPPVAYTSTNAVGAHLAHVFQGDAAAPGPLSSPLFCANCHTGMLYTAAPHTTPASPVAFGNLAVAAGATPLAYNQSTQTCTSTYCHGSFGGGKGAVAIAWGTAGKLACNACHGQGTGVAQPTYPHPQNTGCATCHGTGYSTTTVAAATHVNGLIEKSTAGCTACHGDRSDTAVTLTTNTVKAAPGLGAAGTSADTTGATAATSPGVGAHLAHLNGTTFRSAPIACTECHALPSSNTDTAHATGAGTGGARANVLFGALASNAGFGARTPAYSGSSSGAGGATGGTCASTYCHAPRTDTVTGLNQTPAWASPGTVLCGDCHGLPPVAAAHPVNALCSQCHPGYPDSPTATTVLSAAAKLIHINGSLDGGESTGATPCLNCHKTDAATGAAYGKMVSDTTVYHHVVAEGTTFKTYPLTATGQACLQCHADHDVFNPALNAANTLGRGANLRTTIATAPTKVAPASGNYANTDFSGTTGLCLSCHSASLTKSTLQLSTATNTGVATMVVDGTAFGASAHQYTVPGSITTGASPILANCMKCHADPPGAAYPEKQSGTYKFALHTNTDKRLRNPMGITSGADDLEEKSCFRCHSNSTDALPAAYGPAKAVANMDYFNAAAMTVASQNLYRTFTDTTHATAMHNVIAYSGKHQPIETGAYIAANRHVECEDCHNPHAAKAGAKPASNSNLVWGPLTGVSGVNIATWPAAWTNTTAASYTMVTASTYEWQICFTCHSANNSAISTWTGLSTLAMTDLALEFNPANKSRHPVVSALNAAGSGTTVLAASQLLTPWAPGNVMTCSDCHGADSVAPATQGPHGSAVRFLLHGTNRAWPYTTAGANTGTLFTMSNTATGLGTANGLFCRNCHPDPAGAAGTTNAGHIQFRGQHGGNAISTCVRCHVRVPHGGKVSRLIATSPNTPARYQVSGQTLNLLHFTKNTTTGYSGNSWFQSSCNTHSGNGSAGEAW